MKYIDTNGNVYFGYDFYCDIAIRMVEARKKRGVTQNQLAEKSGISVSRISNMENVKMRFRLTDLKIIAKALDVDVDWIIGSEPDSEIGECIYLVWNERFPDLKIYHKSFSPQRAFLEMYERFHTHYWLEPRDRAVIKLVGIPLAKKEMDARFLKRTNPDEDDPLEQEVET